MQGFLNMRWYTRHLVLALSSLTLSLSLTSMSRVGTSTPVPNESPANAFQPPDDEAGAPDDTVGAGSRDGGHCLADRVAQGTPGFAALMPARGQTNSERPTFSLHVPPTVAKAVFFSLKDAEEDYYYQTTIPLPDTPGEFRFPLPEEAPALEIGKEYVWSFSLICRENIDPNDPTLNGSIRRIEGDRAIEPFDSP
jgi:hypothetical protein